MKGLVILVLLLTTKLQKVVAKIFQPFFTTKPTCEGTTCLGLSLRNELLRMNTVMRYR
jgi:hypothetical protein